MSFSKRSVVTGKQETLTSELRVITFVLRDVDKDPNECESELNVRESSYAALRGAHRDGMVHRRVQSPKPENVKPNLRCLCEKSSGLARIASQYTDCRSDIESSAKNSG